MRTLTIAMGAIAMSAAALVVVPSAAEAQKRQRDRITREEILASPQKDRDLYEVIRAIRPHFLEPPKGIKTLGHGLVYPIVVYVDGKKDTGLDALKLMSPQDIQEVRYFDGNQALAEFGPNANGGAIVVKRFKGERVIPAAIADTTKSRPDTTKPPREQ